MEKSRKPKIRFKGYNDDWEQRKLSGILCEKNERTSDFNSFPLYSLTIENGITPKTDRYERSSLVTKTEDLFKIVNQNEFVTNPMNLRFGALGYNKNPHYISVSGYYDVFSIDNDKCSAFWNSYFKTVSVMTVFDNAATGSLIEKRRVKYSTLKQISLLMPIELREKQKIGTLFEDIDELITLHQRKLDKLINVKKSMLEKMFPKEGSTVPEIRFNGFTQAWEQRKLGELLTRYTDEVNVPHNGYERLGIRSHAKGTFHSYVSEGHELQTGKMHKVAADKFIVNITFGWEHAVAVTDKNDAGKLVSHRFPQYSLSENLYSKFFKYIILDDKFKHHLWLSSPGGAGRNRVLKLDEMLEYKIKIPNVQEQQKIAEVLMDLDHLITLHQRKLEKLKNIKKSMLEKMFV